MKKNKLLVALVAAMALVAALPLSAAKKKDGSVTLKKKDVSFDNKVGSLTINNETSDELVVFAGRVEKDAVLGGIHKNSTGFFDLRQIPGIPASGSLLIRAAQYEVYKGKARVTEDDVVWTGLVVYNLNDPSDKSLISIYRGIDTTRQTCIYASNLSPNFVLELRLDTPTQGDVIATLPPLLRNKQIFLAPKPDGTAYDVYPTYIYVNPKTGEKSAMTASDADAEIVDPEPVGMDMNVLEFRGPSVNNVSYKVSFLRVTNNTKKGLEFKNGTRLLANQRGRRNTLSGRMDTYEIASEMGPGGQSYDGLFGRFPGNVEVKLGEVNLKPGYVYEVKFTQKDGNYECGFREVEKKSLVESDRISLFGE